MIRDPQHDPNDVLSLLVRALGTVARLQPTGADETATYLRLSKRVDQRTASFMKRLRSSQLPFETLGVPSKLVCELRRALEMMDRPAIRVRVRLPADAAMTLHELMAWIGRYCVFHSLGRAARIRYLHGPSNSLAWEVLESMLLLGEPENHRELVKYTEVAGLIAERVMRRMSSQPESRKSAVLDRHARVALTVVADVYRLGRWLPRK